MEKNETLIEPGRCPYCDSSDTYRSDGYHPYRCDSKQVSITLYCYNCHKNFTNKFLYAGAEKGDK